MPEAPLTVLPERGLTHPPHPLPAHHTLHRLALLALLPHEEVTAHHLATVLFLVLLHLTTRIFSSIAS